MLSVLRSGAVILVMISIIGCNKSPFTAGAHSSTFGIYNGVNAGQAVAGIGELYGVNAMGTGSICTAFEVGGRCLLTAAHCVYQITPTRYFQEGQVNTTSSVYIPAVRSLSLSGAAQPTEFNDLAIIWLGLKACDPSTSQCNLNAAYTPFQPSASTPPGGQQNLSIEGYGMFLPGNPNSVGTARGGSMYWSQTVTNAMAGAGAYYVFNTSTNQVPLNGDSGGPVYSGNVAYGVVSTSSWSAVPMWAHYTAFQNGNDTWYNNNAPSFCEPRLGVNVSVSTPGIVTGYINNNLVINCGQGNNQCSVSPDGPPPQNSDIVLNATPLTGHQFVQWRTTSGNCPCNEGAFSQTCTLSVENFYIPTVNMVGEVANCGAQFQ